MKHVRCVTEDTILTTIKQKLSFDQAWPVKLEDLTAVQ